jgi:hypothetical protein
MPLVFLGGAAVVIAALSIAIAARPGAFHIERSIEMDGPPDGAFAHVNNLQAWADWSPWDKIDPQMKRTFGGPAAGPGATYAWVGKRRVGEGRMTVVKSEPPSLVAIKLEFLKPWTATNMTTFTFTPTERGTRVMWSMDGENRFLMKCASLFMNMDKMIGKDFERGLEALKLVSEPLPKAA